MIKKDFFAALDELEREKRIKKSVFIEALETALVIAYKKHKKKKLSAVHPYLQTAFQILKLYKSRISSALPHVLAKTLLPFLQSVH